MGNPALLGNQLGILKCWLMLVHVYIALPCSPTFLILYIYNNIWSLKLYLCPLYLNMFIPQYLNWFVRSEWGHHGKAMVWTPPTARCQHRGVLHSTSAAHFSRPHRLALLGDAGLGWKKHGIRRPAGVYCGSCLFVVVLSVLSLSLSRLSPWHGFLPRLTWIPLPPSSFSFCLQLSLLVVGSTLLTPRSTPAWVCTSCCHFDGCFRFFSVASYIQYLIHWLLCRTPFTRITFLNIAFFKPFLNMAFSKTLVYTHALVQT